MLNTAILAGVVGGLIWLDKFQVLQLMVSRPIVCGPIVGWCLGDVSAGLASGILFELLWLRRPPIGGFISPDVTFGAIAASAISSWILKTGVSDVLPVVFIAFLVVFPVCYIGTRLDAHLRRYTGKIALRAEVLQKAGKEGKVFAWFLASLALGFSLAFSLIFTATLYGMLVLSALWDFVPPRAVHAAGLAYYVVPLIGVADVLVGLNQRTHLIMFLIGLLGTLGALLFLGLL